MFHDKVYAIPVIFIVGWRGEPGIHDEPQHIYQGEVTVKLLEDMDIKTFVIGKETKEEKLDATLKAAKYKDELSMIEVKCSIGARANLGRPTTTPLENKQNFMEYLKTL